MGGASSQTPGLGVIPWSNITYTFVANAQQPSPQPPGGSPDEDIWDLSFTMSDDTRGRSGFGAGIPGRVVAGIAGENPPVNAIPQRVSRTPITTSFINDNRFDGGDTLNTGIFGAAITISSNIDASFYGEILPDLYKLIAVFAMMQLLDNFILQPNIFSKSVKAHPLEIFVIILIGAKLGGVMGMILAIPAYTIFRVIAKVFLSEFKIVQSITRGI